MKTKDEIKHEIYDLTQKVSRASSEKFLLETAREIYELAALLKHAPKDEPQTAPAQEAKMAAEVEEPIKAETAAKEPVAQPTKQATIDLFSDDTAPAETQNTVPVPIPAPEPPAAVEKPVQKEKKEPKKKKEESVAEKLQHNKITDLKASIGINEKFQFINELFEGNMKEYNCAVDQINSFSSHQEAESYINNLEDVYKWQADNHIAENFKELVERRFS